MATNRKKITLLDISSYLLLFFPMSLFLGNAVTEITICSIAIFFLIHSYNSNDFSWLNKGWVKVSMLLWLYFCLRSLWAPDVLLSLKRGAPYIRFIVFAAAIAYWVIPKHHDTTRLMKSLFLTVIIASCSAISQYFIGFDFFGNPPRDLGTFYRLTNFSGKLAVGIILSMIFFPTASYLLAKHRKIAVPYIIIGFIAVLLSGERTALLLLTTGLTMVLLLHKEFRPYLAYFVIAICILGAGVAMMKSDVLTRQFSSTYRDISTIKNNVYGKIFHIAIDQFQEKPIFGTGLRHFQKSCFRDEYNPAWVIVDDMDAFKMHHCVNHPHNIYLELLSETGIIGFLLFAAFIYSILHYVWVSRSLLAADAFKTGAFINILLKLLPIVSTSSLFFAWAASPLWFMLGILFSTQQKSSKLSKD